MDTSKAARDYLRDAMPPDSLAPASRALGFNHAYLHRYINKGIPRWLKAEDREALVEQYGLDEGKLKPPPKPLRPIPPKRSRGHGDDEGQVDPPGGRQFNDDPRTIQLLSIWARIPSDDRDLALRVLNAMVDRSEPIAIVA